MSSLLSILSTLTNGTSASSNSNAQISAVQARIDAAKADAASNISTGGAASGTSISDAAKLAAAATADNAKDFSALGVDVRKALDAQYAKGAQSDTLDPSALSGRALAAMAIDKDGQFSRAEQAVARLELRQREQDTLVQALSTGFSIASLASYGKALAEQYDAMSAEERMALGYTGRVRLNAGQMAGTVSPIALFAQE